MRNFSSISNATFESYTINGGEYQSDSPAITDVLTALAEAFETPLGLVAQAWRDVAINGKVSAHVGTSESEDEVLLKLFDFARFVELSIREDGWKTKSKVFSYYNLNTGGSVIWLHTVC